MTTFKTYLIAEATNAGELAELKAKLDTANNHYNTGDRHTRDEAESYKKTVTSIKARIDKLQGTETRAAADPGETKQNQADVNYKKAKSFINSNTPKLKELEDSKDDNKQRKWQIAIAKKELDKAQKYVDNYTGPLK